MREYKIVVKCKGEERKKTLLKETAAYLKEDVDLSVAELRKEIDIINKDVDYLFGKTNWGRSWLDADAIKVMNTLKTRMNNLTKIFGCEKPSKDEEKEIKKSLNEIKEGKYFVVSSQNREEKKHKNVKAEVVKG